MLLVARLCLAGVAYSQPVAPLACPDLNGTVAQLASTCLASVSCDTCLSAIETSVAPALEQAGFAANSSGFAQCLLSYQLALEAAGVNASTFTDCATSSSTSSSSSTTSSDASGVAATPPTPSPSPPAMPPPPTPRPPLPPVPASAPGPATSSVDRSGASAAIAVCILLAAGLCGVACVRMRKRMRIAARPGGAAGGLLPFANVERRSWAAMEER